MDPEAVFRPVLDRLDRLIAAVEGLSARLAAGDADPDGYLSREAAARLAGVSVRTLDKAITAGVLASVTRGRRRLVPRQKVLEWTGG